MSERAGLKNLRVDRHRREAGHPNEPWLKQIARNHHGKDNILLFPRAPKLHPQGPVQCRERLGGLLRHYHQEAA